MTTPSAKPEPLRRFGAFVLDSRSRELLKANGRQKLQEQPFQVLSALLERSGEVVTKEELRQRIWAGNTFVDYDRGLSVSIAKLRQALDDDAVKPRFIETLPRLGYRFVAPVQIMPLDGEGPAATSRRARPRWVWGLLSTVTLLGLAAWMPLAIRSNATGPASIPRPSVAIMGFQNLTAKPEQNWLSTALSEMLAVEFAAGQHVRTIPGESVAHTKIQMSLPEAESYSAATLAKIRKSLGADYVLVGSYLETGGPPGRVRLNLILQDAKTGETVTTFRENGTEDDLAALVAEAGSTLRQKLAAGFVSPAESSGARAALPPTTDSARLYAEGLDRLRHFDARAARDLLEQAVAVDPNYAMAHAALSDAWSALGYAAVARDEARKAWQLSAQLPAPDRLSIEALYRETGSEWDQAIRIYQRLAEQFPDNADYGLHLAGAQINAGKANEALLTLDRLRRLSGPLANDAAIKLAQSQAQEALGDFEKAQAAATDAADLAQARGAKVLEANALTTECQQLVELSRLDRAVKACEDARDIYKQVDDRPGMAASMAYLASAYCNQGQTDRARNLYTQALDMNREIGNARGDAQWALNGLAVLLMDQGDLGGARKLYEESLAMARLVSSRPDEASALGNIASTWLAEGDLQRARDMLSQALKRSRSIGARFLVANVLNNLGQALYLSGDLPEAARMLDEAVASDRETGAKLESADALSWLARVRMAQADWEGARRNFDESVRLAREIDGQVSAATYRVAGAELALEMGRATDAEAPIREGLEAFRHAKVLDRELDARTLLARVLLDQGRLVEARQEVTRADTLARASQHRAARLAFAIVSARAAASTGAPAEVTRALQALEGAAADAGREGFLGYQLEARLALGGIESKQGHGPAARGLLEKVEKDARASGYESIARNAARALGKS